MSGLQEYLEGITRSARRVYGDHGFDQLSEIDSFDLGQAEGELLFGLAAIEAGGITSPSNAVVIIETLMELLPHSLGLDRPNEVMTPEQYRHRGVITGVMNALSALVEVLNPDKPND